MNRSELRQLADERGQDAIALLNAGQWSGAYYMVGYAVECALKACIAKRTNQHDYPDKDLALKCYTHDIEALVKVAGLGLQRNSDIAANQNLGTNWLIVKDWNEKARYQSWGEPETRKLVAAVTDKNDGVLSWIRVHW